jgi:hypothetical protein
MRFGGHYTYTHPRPYLRAVGPVHRRLGGVLLPPRGPGAVGVAVAGLLGRAMEGVGVCAFVSTHMVEAWYLQVVDAPL